MLEKLKRMMTKKKKTKRQFSKGGDALGSTSSPPSGNGPKDKSYLRKRIMPNLCECCTIGIGTSMQKVQGVWQQYYHENRKVNRFRYKKRVYKLCDDCYERAEKKPERLNKI